MSQILNMSDLKEDSWYIPVFERFARLHGFGELMDKYRIDSPYYKYLGNGEFVNEYGDTVTSFFDPELQMNVALDATDGFI